MKLHRVRKAPVAESSEFQDVACIESLFPSLPAGRSDFTVFPPEALHATLPHQATRGVSHHSFTGADVDSERSRARRPAAANAPGVLNSHLTDFGVHVAFARVHTEHGVIVGQASGRSEKHIHRSIEERGCIEV